MLDFSQLTLPERACFVAVLRFLVEADRHAFFRSDLNDHTFPGVPKPFMRMALKGLVAKKFLTVNDDINGDPSAWELHDDIAADAFEFVEAGYKQPDLSPPEEEVPAADRFVRIDHNNPVFRDTQEKLETLAEAVVGNNETFQDSDQRHAVVREIRNFMELMQGQLGPKPNKLLAESVR